MSLEKIENSLKKCPDLPEIKILGWQLCNITDFIQYLLLHFYFRVQVPLKYPCEILFWLSREIFKTIITYKALLYNSNIFYCIQYDKELTILPKTIAQILELKNGDFQINLVSIQEPLYYNESLCTCVDHFIIMKVSVLVWIFFINPQSTYLRIQQYNVILPLITKLMNNSIFLSFFLTF